MDSKKFDELVKKVSQQITRRSLVKESLGAAALAALGITEEALAKAKNNRGKGQDKNRGKNDSKARPDGKGRRANRDKNKKDNKPRGEDEDGGTPPVDTGDAGDVPPTGSGNEGDVPPADGSDAGGEGDTSEPEGGGDSIEPVAAQARRRKVQAEACIPSGKICPSKKPRGKKKKKLGCTRCCQHFSVPAGGGKRKCACKPDTVACDNDSECCSGVCAGECVSPVS